MKKTLLLCGEQPAVHKNLAAIYTQKGDYNNANTHVREALNMMPNDSMNHRNFAKVRDALGDARQSFEHNKIAIELDLKQGNKPSSRTFRQTAVQNIAHGGNLADSLALMKAARSIEGKKYESPTTITTHEIISKIMKRKGDPMEALEMEQKVCSLKSTLKCSTLIALTHHIHIRL